LFRYLDILTIQEMENQGEALRTVLINHRVSITDLAKRLKVSRTTIYNWFEMVIVPYEHLEAASDKLGLDLFEEIRLVLNKRDVKFYKPLKTGESAAPAESEQVAMDWKFAEKTPVTFYVDGTESTLLRNIEKMKLINAALSIR